MCIYIYVYIYNVYIIYFYNINILYSKIIGGCLFCMHEHGSILCMCMCIYIYIYFYIYTCIFLAHVRVSWSVLFVHDIHASCACIYRHVYSCTSCLSVSIYHPPSPAHPSHPAQRCLSVSVCLSVCPSIDCIGSREKQ